MPTNANASPAPSAPPVAPPTAPPVTSDASSWTYTYPTGRWVYANGYGWMWVPANTATVDDSGVPYAYLYTPSYGWTWYVSPWGGGGFYYGSWVRRPWHPVGWGGVWVAHPSVVVRLGGGHSYYSRPAYHYGAGPAYHYHGGPSYYHGGGYHGGYHGRGR